MSVTSFWSVKKVCRHLNLSYSRLSLLRHLSSLPEAAVGKWEAVIGLEVHAKLRTSSKLFAASSTQFAGPTNEQVAFFDAALPGTLPVLNKACVAAGVLSAIALNCKVNMVSSFDRKHYFYADLPAGYQITQQRRPIATDGLLTYTLYNPAAGIKAPRRCSARITQLQLEQDSAKSLHDADDKISLIDLNRAGVGLMEIVTEPDFRSGAEAAAFVKEMQAILRVLGTCDGIMSEGSMRVDASVSVRRPGDPLGTRREVKNINMIRNIVKAIDFEIGAQIDILESGGEVENETRAFDQDSGQTIAMRDKEKVHDYRFMPEPNLPPLRLYTDEDIERLDVDPDQVVNVDQLRRSLPELPMEKRERLQRETGVSEEQAYNIVNQPGMQDVFENMVTRRPDLLRRIYNFLFNEVMELYNKENIRFTDRGLDEKELLEIVIMLAEGTISMDAAIKVLANMHSAQGTSQSVRARDIVEQLDLQQITDDEEIVKLCQNIMDSNPKAVKDYRRGKKRVINFFIGQMMKETNRKAHPGKTKDTFTKLLNDNK